MISLTVTRACQYSLCSGVDVAQELLKALFKKAGILVACEELKSSSMIAMLTIFMFGARRITCGKVRLRYQESQCSDVVTKRNLEFRIHSIKLYDFLQTFVFSRTYESEAL